MSRIIDGEADDLESLLAMGRMEGCLKMALNSKRGRADLRRIKAALEKMPRKELIEGRLCDGRGVCALGAASYRSMVDRGIAPKEAWKTLRRVGATKDFELREYEIIDATVRTAVDELKITDTLARAVMWENDGWPKESPSDRYASVMRWIDEYLSKPLLQKGAKKSKEAQK